MHTTRKKKLKTTRAYLGIMSGTSLDGIDISIATFEPYRLIQTFFKPYPADLKKQLQDLSNQTIQNELDMAYMLANQLAKLYASAVTEAQYCLPHDITIAAIGCHGQTIRHCPDKGYSIQLNNAALLAELTGIDVVSDFRSRDIAAHGQGAPLVCAFHQEYFGCENEQRFIINIGGISNMTVLTPQQPILGFDCGPGNCLLDAWIQKHLKKNFDKNGAWASQGVPLNSLLNQLMAHPFFEKDTPKSCGKENFSLTWLESHLSGKEKPEDVQLTLVYLTAKSISLAIENIIRKESRRVSSRAYLCGGGAHNSTLVKLLSEQSILLMSPITIPLSFYLTDSLNVPIDWVEAIAFAWLAKQTLDKKTGNIASVTGASGERILGCITYA